MMTLRTRIFIVASLIFFAILGVSIIVLVQSRKDKEQPQNTAETPKNQAVQTGIKQTVIPAGVTVKPPTEEEVKEETIKQFARVFVERFNSYSTDNNFQNVKDVKSLVTDSYWKKISGIMNNNAPAQSFMAVITKVVSAEINSIENDKAIITLKTQKTTEKDGSSTTSYSDYVVTLSKENSGWKVNDQMVK